MLFPSSHPEQDAKLLLTFNVRNKHKGIVGTMRLLILVCCILICIASGLSSFLFAMSSQPVESIMMFLVTFAMMYTAKKLHDW